MSVKSHRHVQFPRGQHSKTGFHSGGSAAKESSYIAKDKKVSPESEISSTRVPVSISFHSTDRSPHRSFSRMDYSHNSSPVKTDNRYLQHQRSTIRYHYKEESLYLGRKYSPDIDYKYKQRRKRTPSPSSRQILSKRYWPFYQRPERTSSRRNRQQNRPDKKESTFTKSTFFKTT